jgi:hypothetical protein
VLRRPPGAPPGREGDRRQRRFGSDKAGATTVVALPPLGPARVGPSRRFRSPWTHRPRPWLPQNAATRSAARGPRERRRPTRGGRSGVRVGMGPPAGRFLRNEPLGSSICSRPQPTGRHARCGGAELAVAKTTATVVTKFYTENLVAAACKCQAKQWPLQVWLAAS